MSASLQWGYGLNNGSPATKFVDIFDGAKGIYGDEQRRSIRPALLRLAQENCFRSWAVGDSIPADGRRLLIGVVEGSRYDFEFLDVVCGSDKFKFLDIFMLSDCMSQSKIEAFIPGIAPVFLSPAIGVWDYGTLIVKANGFGAAKQAVAVYGIMVI
jgi:hypothetical protein